MARFDRIYKQNAYTMPIKYCNLPWGGFMLAYEEVIRTWDGQGKFLAQLPILVKRVVESVYFDPRFHI